MKKKGWKIKKEMADLLRYFNEEKMLVDGIMKHDTKSPPKILFRHFFTRPRQSPKKLQSQGTKPEE